MSSHYPSHVNDRDGTFPSIRGGFDPRAASMKTLAFSQQGLGPASPAMTGPGSFNPDPKAASAARNETKRPPLVSTPSYRSEGYDDDDEKKASELRQAELRDQIDRELKIKLGSENMLEALNTKNAKQSREQRTRVENELNTSNLKIAQLKLGLEAEIQRAKEVTPTTAGRLTELFQNAPARSPSRFGYETEDRPSDTEGESPSFLLAELLQALENEGMPTEYYVKRANDLVDLFKRYPALKYDLAWSIFGLRVQTMLLSGSDEVVAAGYRVMRYAITDLKSLRTMRSLHTDFMVMLSLVKGSKATLEREQALKFIRAFLDVKNGVEEISKAVLRVVVAVAENVEDRLRGLCILTLAEVLVRSPSLVSSAGGLGILLDTLSDGSHPSSAMLVGPLAFLLDIPSRRQCLRSGHDITGPFAAFTEQTFRMSDDKLQQNAKVIIALLKTWPGLITLSLYNFAAIRSLTASLAVQVSQVRDVILDIVFEVLGIKPPSWSTSFLAGRRLTTYGRVTNLKADLDLQQANENLASDVSRDLFTHYTATMLAVFLQSGLIDSLVAAIEAEYEPRIKKKATLLLGETLHMATDRLPNSSAIRIQVLPGLFSPASIMGAESRFISSSAIYQIDSINRILSRSTQSGQTTPVIYGDLDVGSTRAQNTVQNSFNMEEGQFRFMLLETQVLNTVNFSKWRWDLIQKIVDGPLRNPKRIDEATKATKFVKRLLGFLTPFKYRFSDVRNTKPNQRYVRAGCALIKSLLETTEGTRFLAENKLLRQVAECLAQVDSTSGLTSATPLFSPARLLETLSGGYFAILGVLSGSSSGLAMMERWKMINMFYHIIELQDRNDLVKSLLTNMDYSLDSHLRVILSKAMTSCSKPIRIFSTRLLRRHAIKRSSNHTVGNEPLTANVEWAINLLITQLYDPEIEVCEAAVRILEEACDDKSALEYVVQCRPALDHLGEIGAPLLLRFLSTSMGYQYLDGLDYISQEMDDWFLGRNENYVMLVEAAMAKVFSSGSEKAVLADDDADMAKSGNMPPHFYRELARTTDGCRLLESKGHFEEFVSIIQTSGMEHEDLETMTKVKGCLWAVGNVGSMELGAPFLESTNVVKLIIDIAEKSSVMTMRGTALFVLGLISRSVHGQEMLAEQGWEVSVDEMGAPLGICLPADIGKIFSITSWNGTETDTARIPQTYFHVEDTSKPKDGAVAADADVHADSPRILSLVKSLGFTILTKKSAGELHSIKAKHPQYFQDHHLFEQIMGLLEQHHFRLPVLRFVYDLFDKKVIRRIVLEEESESEDDD